jgi:hypothetical protein
MLNEKAENSQSMLYNTFNFHYENSGGDLNPFEKWYLTRNFYDMVFSNTAVDTKLFSMSATKNDVKTCKDHFTTPQWVGRAVFDNWEDFAGESGRQFFREVFEFCLNVVIVTKQENTTLSKYTVNNLKQNEFYLKKGLLERYEEEFDKMYLEGFGYVPVSKMRQVLDSPVLDWLLEKEKDYLRS